jgi:hypothetical protein
MKMKYPIILFSLLMMVQSAMAQNPAGGVLSPDESLPTLLSFRLAAGYGIGRARQNLGTNGTDPIWWSAGQGVKLDAALDIPLLPIEVLNTIGDENEPERFSIVGLEAELASGYHISGGGKFASGDETIIRTYTYVPITIGFNTRASFGAGMPSVYIGIGGGIHWAGIYEDNITVANSSTTIRRQYDPPIPFELYGQLGLEIPLLYSADDGNSMLDLFVQAKLSEVTNYIYDYRETTSTPTGYTTTVVSVSGTGVGETASNVAFTLGIKYNLY